MGCFQWEEFFSKSKISSEGGSERKVYPRPKKDAIFLKITAYESIQERCCSITSPGIENTRSEINRKRRSHRQTKNEGSHLVQIHQF